MPSNVASWSVRKSIDADHQPARVDDSDSQKGVAGMTAGAPINSLAKMRVRPALSTFEVKALGLEPKTYGLKVRCSTD